MTPSTCRHRRATDWFKQGFKYYVSINPNARFSKSIPIPYFPINPKSQSQIVKINPKQIPILNPGLRRGMPNLRFWTWIRIPSPNAGNPKGSLDSGIDYRPSVKESQSWYWDTSRLRISFHQKNINPKILKSSRSFTKLAFHHPWFLWLIRKPYEPTFPYEA